MRSLTSHQVNGCNETIDILVMDEPGHGGACHQYQMHLLSEPGAQPGLTGPSVCKINFQNGPIREAGVNGFTHEALLAILEDRLTGFQSGPYACDENAWALYLIRVAQGVLKSRTAKRLARGVEGTHKV